jgi:hypothetical protein
MRQEKRKINSEEIKLFLFAEDMILYLKDLKDSTTLTTLLVLNCNK